MVAYFQEQLAALVRLYPAGGDSNADYRFHLLLRSIFPDAVPYMNSSRDHVVSKIGDRFYDIRGRVPVKREDEYHLMDAGEIKSAAKWAYKARKH